MKVRVLAENRRQLKNFKKVHGLSLYIEAGGSMTNSELSWVNGFTTLKPAV